MFKKVNVLSALMLKKEEDVAANLTLIHNASNWGHSYTRGKIPGYESVSAFQKHSISLASLSLKGYRKMSHEHSTHLMPPDKSDFQIKWMFGVMGSLADFSGTGDPIYWDKLFELGLTDSTVRMHNGEQRCNGRNLLRLLFNVGQSESPLKVPKKSQKGNLPETMLSIAKIEQKGRMNEERGGWGMYAGMDITAAGKSQRDVFRDAEVIERVVVDCTFMRKEIDGNAKEWGEALIPKLLDYSLARDRSREARMTLSQRLLYVCIDILQVSVAVGSVQSTKDMLGDESHVDQSVLRSLRVKLGMFMECLLPAMTYSVFCSTVEYQELLSQPQVTELLRKFRNSKKVVFKLLKEKVMGQREDNVPFNVSVNSDTTHDEMRSALEDSMVGKNEGSVLYEMREISQKDLNVTNLREVDSMLRDDGEVKMDSLVGNWDAVTLGTVGYDVNAGANEELNGAEDSLLGFAGAPIYLVEKRAEAAFGDGTPSGEDSSKEKSAPTVAAAVEERRRLEEDFPVANVCDRTLGNDDISTPEGRQVSRSWGSNSGSGASGDGPFSSTKIGEGVKFAGADLRRGLSPILRTSPIGGKTGCCGMRSRQVAPMEVLPEAKILLYLEREATKLTEKEKSELLQYIAKDPPEVNKDKWKQVLEVVGEALLNGTFMIKTAVAARTGAAVLIARYVSRLATEYEEGLSEIQKAEFEALMKDESKFYRLDLTLSKLKFMQQKLRTGDSVYYLSAILKVFYPDAIRKSSALKIHNMCKK